MTALNELPLAQTDVLVVGAGPTGLMAGLVLARRGLCATVIDTKTGPTRESRALAVHARSMEIYHQLGLAEQVLAGSHPATEMQLRAGAPGLRLDLGQRGATLFPGVQIFEQSRNETLLSAALTAAGRPVRWRTRLVDLNDEGDHVTALVEGPDGLGRIRARWCIGADGARSTVRRILDIPFEGVTDDAAFFVADLRGVPGQSDHAVTARFGDRSFALMFPLGPGGHARLVALTPRPGQGREQMLADACRDLGLGYEQVDWFSTYRVHHRVAATFGQGNVFVAGDAAHVHSPVGGQGMNTGLQDAHNLTNLLADVAAGYRIDAALAGYESERRPVALRLVHVTDRAFGLIARRGPVVGALRRGWAASAGRILPWIVQTRVAPVITGWVGQYRIRYHFVPKGSALPAWAADPAVGRRLAPVGDNHSALRSFTWQLHTYGSTASRPEVPEWVDGPTDFGADPTGSLRPGRLYLIRPDGFVAATIPVNDSATLTAALAAHQIVR